MPPLGAVKRLTGEKPASRTFARRLERTVGRSASQAKLQAGLVKAAVLILAGGVVLGGGVLAMGLRTPETVRLLAKMEAAVNDPASVGVLSYSGVYRYGVPGIDMEITFQAPDKALSREKDSGRILPG